ncbi:MAG: polysaccharide deacetylase family protein [Schleiferilactobacillus perolens]|jgi:peptidoglycan/xylan/chitin deacetylase (PgdA/CDA1 family)|uniref:polysaccharide deacetylase family protein n=1 Tax=Schleiferilactobacillus perolens TaxID=100468 RepID=UPI0039ED426F|nr:polysaccharide deacetylase family protein [Schleiferilactobacillus harbinensis]MCI1911633.1 polysaccharide deacetylase family protein [Schleiferilactobacillus harbinensis]
MRLRNKLVIIFGALILLGGGGAVLWRYLSQANRTAESRVVKKKQSSQRSAAKRSSRASAAHSTSAKEASLSSVPTDGENHITSANAYTYDPAAVREKMAQRATPGEQKVVFLTFDDGVNTKMSPRVLAVLKQFGVHATFFVVGDTINAQTAPILKQEYDEGNGIGIHSFTHVYSTLYPKRKANPTAIYNEAIKSLTAMRGVLGQQFMTHAWRYPGGHMSWQNLAAADADLAKLKMTWMDWNAAVGDALGAAAPKNVAASMKYHAASLNVYPNSAYRVVLMHDAEDKNVTLQTLPSIIQYYKNNGYRFGILG